MEDKRISVDSVLFHQAINNPLSVSESDLLALIVKFPYVQSLRFAYERHLYTLNKGETNISSTLLYAANPNWLYEYLHKAAPQVVENENILQETDLIEDIEVEKVETKDELDLLIQSGVAQDFFQLEQKEEVAPKITEEVLEIPIIEEKGMILKSEPTIQEEERVSIYDDELMPYSFLWWLHKTRLEHANTYQPFVKAPVLKSEPTNDDIDRIKNTIDAQLLDQQIRENIFHLQSPEVKLSDEVKNTVPFQVERKSTDDLIEKFIKEDPQIKPPPADKINLENKARKSSEDQYSLVTETLARIYTEQGLYPKAIEVYKKLVLKYPEKNAYFAAEILNLEKKLT